MELVTQTSEDLFTVLERFNRKERFILFEQALTDHGRAPLSKAYRRHLSDRLGIEIPRQVDLTAIDYHLNWLYAGLELWEGSWDAEPGPGGKPFDRIPQVVGPTGPRWALEVNQEDVDLLLGWRDPSDQHHLALVEAKAYTSWSNKQLASKAARLRSIFGDDGDRYEGVEPHFVLTSFAAPTQKLETDGWPRWMLREGAPVHVDLTKNGRPRYVVGRVDEEGKPSSNGEWYGIREHA